MDTESDELNSCSQTVYNILCILTLLNFKVLKLTKVNVKCLVHILLSSSYSQCRLRHASILLNIKLQVSHCIYFRSGQNKGGGWVVWVLSNLNSKQEIFIYVFCKKQKQNILLESSQSSNINNVRLGDQRTHQ